MKHTRVSLLALSALAGGTLIASAADVGTNYNLYITFTNNPAPRIVSIWGLPTLSTNYLAPGNWGVTATDGGGKIDGVWDLTVTNLTGPNVAAMFVADISGAISTVGKSNTPTVRLSVRGAGYAQTNPTNATTQVPATLTYTFTGSLTNRSSSVGPLFTNGTLISVGADGTTNDTSSFTFTGSTTTNVTVLNDVGYTNLEFYVNTSVNVGTNAGATNQISQHNEAYFDSGEIAPSPLSTYTFGTVANATVVTNLTFTSYVAGTNTLVTNVFNVYAIGTNIEFESFNGIVDFAATNAVFGFAYSNLSAFITAYGAGRQYGLSNAAPSTAFVLRGESTNWNVGSSSSTTDISTNGGQTYSDNWREIAGVLKGTIKAGAVATSLNGQRAVFGESHTIYTQLANDTNGFVVLGRDVNDSSDFWDQNAFNSFSTKVVTFGRTLLMSSDDGMGNGGWSGKGTLNHARTNYTASLRGAGDMKGSSAKINGKTGPMDFGSVALTNLVTITNIAAFPQVTVSSNNTSGSLLYTARNFSNVTTNIVSGTNVYVGTNFWRVLPIPGASTTISIPDAIMTMNAAGKVMGQKVVVSGHSTD